MSIESRDYDYWESEIHGLPCGLYFYFINQQTSDDTIFYLDTRILGNCGAIQSVQYVPFITEEDLKLYKIRYDMNRFGDEDSFRLKFRDLEEVYCYRIDDVTTVKKDIAEFKCYQPSKNIGGPVDWRNESRLYNYPYMFAYITDHLNPPMEIKYHLCKTNTSSLKVKSTVSDRCSYGLYIDGYKGDTNGTLEAMVSGDAHEIPCSSSPYNTWVASNKNQIAQNIKNMQANTLLQNQGVAMQQEKTAWDSGLSIIGGAIDLLGGGGGDTIATSAVNWYYSGKEAELSKQMNNQNVQNAIHSAIASSSDMKSIPNTMISMGSDVYYGLANGEYGLYLYRMGLDNDVYKRLGDYFALYGYKQNKILPVGQHTRTRYYYNYIKTIGCNITGDVPRKYMNMLKNIFDSGVTLWHVDREGVEVLHHGKADNYEYNE